ncbi:5-(carboxyamino)imidazole ribonucleotide mutase [Fervidicoccus fontis]|uniref:N5-carboxyaminoimidazole ribonucleotide mutase n=2 Tax=Fervidicoccus fontis TaxID=683846 RepID=I0A0P3_FERFK|nr:5-(carboxyamino)imidazole ribonucleotide mutase [Fervidicoccus fontis]AFH42550.1 phosphoribosylaminoimidazole carboxylase [Fervidicoccus fontis Kam940]MBE9391161.1 5-(carboxyamino)imidazole ribonucleotide mutase [Fervidicoccus fontis]PMB78154.1 MAG: 5-(carboxyamino)imidazole ribonucleotide mutase [Fervidicoccus fontis]HEW64039.1 5-(carboxyamino)imidazole ribonucleotide mutase [Fervidicoccus fontis]
MTCKGKVSIIVGSERDLPFSERASKILKENSIEFEIKVLSAHRNPKDLENYISNSDVDVFIAMAGLSAHLPGFIASRTNKPVIGVPLNVSLGGLDSLLSIVQMPKGVPVATVGIDNPENAAHLAVRIISLCRGV